MEPQQASQETQNSVHQLALEMAQMRGEMRGVVDTVARIESSIRDLGPVTIALAQLTTEHSNTRRDLDDVREPVGKLMDFRATVSGGLTVVALVLGVVLAAGTWLMVRADESRQNDILHAEQIRMIVRAVEELKEKK